MLLFMCTNMERIHPEQRQKTDRQADRQTDRQANRQTVRQTDRHRCWVGVNCDLTHRGRVTHICIGKLTIIGSDNGLSPGRRQVIIWTNTGILLIWRLEIDFNEVLIEMYIFSLKKMQLRLSSAKWRPYCLGFMVLNEYQPVYSHYLAI